MKTLACRFVLVSLVLWGLAVPSTAQDRQWPVGAKLQGYGTASPSPLLGQDGNPAGLATTSGELAIWGGTGTLGGALGLSAGALKLGLGLDYLRPFKSSDFWRFGLGLALVPDPSFAIAALWQPIWSYQANNRSVDGWSIGTTIRPARWLSFGFETHNLGREQFGDWDGVQFVGGLAVRPFGERFVIGADLTTDHEGAYWDPSGYATVDIVEGVKLGASGGARNLEMGWAWWLGGTLTLTIPHGQSAFSVMTDRGEGETNYLVAGRMSMETPARPMRFGGKVVRMALSVAEELPAQAFFSPRTATLLEQRLALRKLARDPEVAGVVISIRPGVGGWARVQELGRSLAELKASGKRVVVYMYGGANREYYLASFADKVVVHPAAVLSVTGIRATMTFFADLLKVIGVEAQFERIGLWKGYPETFTRTEPSPELLESQTTMLDDVYGQLVDVIGTNRGVPREKVQEWIDAGPQTPKRALALGMIDEVADLDEMKTLADLGLANAPTVHGYPYDTEQDDTWGPTTNVAVLVIEGALVDGSSGGLPGFGDMVGAEEMVPIIKGLEKSPSVDAVLVRVNSPGGSPLAAERILAALKALAKVKPVVISMGDVAASGGYYLAMNGSKVLAMPGTVTGSIGIYYGKVVISGLLDKLQIRRTNLERGKHAGWNDLDRRLTDEELGLAAERLAEYYDLFLQRVESGRNMTRAELATLAEGRVYTAQRALKLKLVDQEGGVLEALDLLRATLGVAEDLDVALDFYPRLSFSAVLQRSLGMSLGVGLAQDMQQWVDSLGVWLDTRVWAMEPWLPLDLP